ncbi:hypothetical protein KI387_040038, partial [Taxus chinensis]
VGRIGLSSIVTWRWKSRKSSSLRSRASAWKAPNSSIRRWTGRWRPRNFWKRGKILSSWPLASRWRRFLNLLLSWPKWWL